MGRIEEIVDDLYENDEDFKTAYEILSAKLVDAGLGFGLDTIIDMADVQRELN